jgi:hypothetical protein
MDAGESIYVINLGSLQDTSATRYIFGDNGGAGMLQNWVAQFLHKHKDYGDHADDLGAPGQYAEIHRKIGKLKRVLWDGKELKGEPAREVLLDLIGHCFLAMKHLDENNYGGKPTK